MREQSGLIRHYKVIKISKQEILSVVEYSSTVLHLTIYCIFIQLHKFHKCEVEI